MASLLDEHWRRVFTWRAGWDHTRFDLAGPPDSFGENPFDGDNLWTDCFTFFKNRAKKEFSWVCLLPEQRVFWEVVMGFYLARFPEVFPGPRSLALKLLEFFPKFKVSPLGVENFTPVHLKWLFQIYQGEKELEILKNPIEVVIAFQSVLWGVTRLKRDPETQKVIGGFQEMDELCDKITDERMEDPELLEREKDWLTKFSKGERAPEPFPEGVSQELLAFLVSLRNWTEKEEIKKELL